MDNEKELLYESKGIDIFDHINQLAIDEASARRWVWELLQNAVDIAVSEQGVSTEFILTELSAVFKHNGFPFDELSLNHLFFKKSQKREKKEGEITIGNFGTGFLTTHLLSKKVEISGIYKKRNGAFTKLLSVCLDRSGNEKDITNALKQYSIERENIENNHDTPYNSNNIENTTFSYLFTEGSSGLHTGKRGIEDLQNALSFAIVFISQIKKLKSVEIKNTLDNSDEIYSLDEKSQIKLDDLEILKIQHSDKATYIALVSDNITSIAMQIDFISDNEVKLIAKDKKTPNLFKVFPLIGSELFAFPTIINSLHFEPTKEREGIILSGTEQVKNQIETNQNIMLRVVSFYEKFITAICTDKTYKWSCLYELATIETPENGKHLVDIDWYKLNVLLPIRQTLLTMPIVETENEFSTLENSIFPYVPYGREEELMLFWDICFDFIGSKMPRKQDILAWSKILSGNYEDWKKAKEGINLKYDLEALLKDIKNEITLSQLAQNKFGNDENKAIEWLNKVIEFVFNQAEQPEILNKIAIIPNQMGVFCLIEPLVTDKDKKIPEQLKDILIELSNDNWRKILIHSSIECKLPDTQKRGVTEISKIIDEIIETKQNSVLVRKAVYELISFYSSEFAEEENSENWRRSIWQIAKDLDNEVPEIQELVGLIPTLWKKAEVWLFENLSKDIQTEKDIEHLRVKLNKDTKEESLIWLNSFIEFHETNEKTKYYSDKAIFPNQLGVFKKKNDNLHFDKIKYKQLKDILDELGFNWYALLLDEHITAIKKFDQEKPLTILDISSQINGIIKRNDTIQTEKFKSAVYNLISILPNNNISDRKQLLEFSHHMFPDKVAENPIILADLKDFDFSPCNDWILKELMQELDKKTITLLKNYNNKFKAQTNDEVIQWIGDFVFFIANIENYKPLLNKFAMIPNQKGDFCTLEFLKKDDSIPPDLKEISTCNFIDDDWDDKLLHKDLEQIFFLFDKKDKKINIDDIANEINKKIKNPDEINYTKDFSDFIFRLNKSDTVKNYKNLFPNFHLRKDSLIVRTLGEGEELSSIATLIQNREKLSVLASIAQNNDISTRQLEQIALLSPSQIESILLKLEAKSKDNNLLTDKVKIYHDRTGDYENSSDRNKELGMWGEEFVNKLLETEKNEGKITTYEWHKGEALAYDFTIWKKNRKKYIDVKATEKSFDTPIGITSSEIKEIFKQRSNYLIYRVYNVDLDKLPDLCNANYSKHMPFDKLVKDWELLFSQDYPNGIQLTLDEKQGETDE